MKLEASKLLPIDIKISLESSTCEYLNTRESLRSSPTPKVTVSTYGRISKRDPTPSESDETLHHILIQSSNVKEINESIGPTSSKALIICYLLLLNNN